MAFTAYLQQSQRDRDQLTVWVKFSDPTTTSPTEIVKSYQWTAGTIFATKAEFKAFIAAELAMLNSLGTKANFLVGKEGADISAL